MRKLVFFLLIMTLVLGGTVNPSPREAQILCCHAVCKCSPKNVTCDSVSRNKCLELDGREVIDCSECVAREERD